MIARRLSRHALPLLALLTAIGCSGRRDGLPREPVAGTVTMDGQPLPEAVIQFSPEGDAEGVSVSANTQVKDGAFSIPLDEGLIPGRYRVTISHAEMKDAPVKGRRKASTSKIPSRAKKIGPEQIPARYNSQSELSAEIPPGGKKDLTFELKSK